MEYNATNEKNEAAPSDMKKISKIHYLDENIKMEKNVVNGRLQHECKTCIYIGIYLRMIHKKLNSDCL